MTDTTIQPQAPDLAGPASFAGQPGGGQHSQFFPQDQVIRQEVNLGLIRELVPPTNHIGLTLCPWLEVATDDVVFDYIKGTGGGLAPARAEDSESELISGDDFYSGRGSASVIDWAQKNHYRASDISRYREALAVISQTEGQGGSFPLTVNSITDGFQAKVARDTVARKGRLDNRIEWLITQALATGKIAYDDGKIKWGVDFKRPADQHDQAPASGTYAADTHDPINDILAVQQKVYAKYGVTLRRAIVSRKFLNSLYKSKKFTILTGFAPGQVQASDMPYALKGWGPSAAIETVKAETGIEFIEYDSVMRTRALGSTTFTTTRYIAEDRVIFLPDEAELAQYDDTEIGFAKTLTSPHPANNWQPGFYSWEKEYGSDPWGLDIGSGVKAFPVMPHMELTRQFAVPCSTLKIVLGSIFLVSLKIIGAFG